MEKTKRIIFVRKHLLDIVTKPMVSPYQQSFIIWVLRDKIKSYKHKSFNGGLFVLRENTWYWLL